MQLLHLDSSVLGAVSASRRLSAEIVARQLALLPDLAVTYRDLAADPPLHLSGAHMAARMGEGRRSSHSVGMRRFRAQTEKGDERQNGKTAGDDQRIFAQFIKQDAK